MATHNLPNDFHPMYSTSSEQTSVTWAAHTTNIAFSDEIGHFQTCSGPNAIPPQGSCPKGDFEGTGANQTPTDGDDTGCFPASSSLFVQIGGCTGKNDGFDGLAYQPDWPDGNTAMHPTAIAFTSPLTGKNFDHNYPRSSFETDLPLLEFEITGQSEPLSRLKTGGSGGITAAFSGLSPHVAAQLQHPGPKPRLADLPQATRSDSGSPGADQRRTAHAVHLRVGWRVAC